MRRFILLLLAVVFPWHLSWAETPSKNTKDKPASEEAFASQKEALRKMLNRFTERFQTMEAKSPKALTELSADEWDSLWNQAKEAARRAGTEAAGGDGTLPKPA